MIKRSVLSLLLILFSCGNFLIPEKTGPKEIFQIVWEDFDRYYPFFAHKKVNWDSVNSVYNEQITDSTSEDRLFVLLSEMVNGLRDNHVNIFSKYGISQSLSYPKDAFSPKLIDSMYIKHNYPHGKTGAIKYGFLDSITGYIRYSTFTGSYDSFNKIDTILSIFNGIKGLVVDVRNNGGGSSLNWEPLTERLVENKTLYSYTIRRNGPEHDNFSTPEPCYLYPSGEKIISIPVVVLTNRISASASDDLIFAMKVLPNVTIIGENTAGLTAGPMYRDLPNGWNYRLSAKARLSIDKHIYEETGIEPDIRVANPVNTTEPLMDPVIEKALEILKEKS